MRQRIPLLLKDKALASMRRMVRAFNELDDDGRQTTVMLHLQHSFEMLLKAALRERRVRVFERDTGRSIGFEKCVRLAAEHLGLSAEQIGTLRAIDALRDDEQHWLARSTKDCCTRTPALRSRCSTRSCTTSSTSALRSIFPSACCRSQHGP